MGFVLDAPLPGAHSAPDADAPLHRALLDIAGVELIEVAGAAIWARKAPAADWTNLKPTIAAVIRQVLDESEATLGAPSSAPADTSDDTLLRAVKDLLDQQINPSVAAHGGHISAERVDEGNVYLRMSGGCQGCAASSATLRQGVERMLRAALPQIREIIDITDHGAGETPFYARDPGASAVLARAIPPGAIEWEDGQVVVDPDYLAPRLGLTPETLRAGLHNGDVVGVTETGTGEDEGKTRIILRSPTRAWAAEISQDGTAREIPPPREIKSASQEEQALAERVRAYLAAMPADAGTITYGGLARALNLWAPGSVRKVTRALETTMQQDAQGDLPFLAARVVSRGAGGLPGKGFFDLARALSRGPRQDETEAEFHARQLSEVRVQGAAPGKAQAV